MAMDKITNPFQSWLSYFSKINPGNIALGYDSFDAPSFQWLKFDSPATHLYERYTKKECRPANTMTIPRMNCGHCWGFPM